MKNLNPPTHDEIAHRAQAIWNAQNNPCDQDTAIWLEAERQLITSPQEIPTPRSVETHSASTERVKAVSATVETKSTAEDFAKTATPATEPHAIKNAAAAQRKAANAPQRPTHKDGPKSAVPESGKPVWTKPHSS